MGRLLVFQEGIQPGRNRGRRMYPWESNNDCRSLHLSSWGSNSSLESSCREDGVDSTRLECLENKVGVSDILICDSGAVLRNLEEGRKNEWWSFSRSRVWDRTLVRIRGGLI